MTPCREHDSTLSVHRAFVVHLRADGGPRRARFAGRVEHLSSGRSALFSSLRELLAFFEPVLDAGGRATCPGPGDCPGTDPLARICPMPDPPQEATAPGRPRRQREVGNAPAKRRKP